MIKQTILVIFITNIIFSQYISWDERYPHIQSVNYVHEDRNFTFNNYGGLADSNGYRGIYLKNAQIFDLGLWIVGKAKNEIFYSSNQWNSNYIPGPTFDQSPGLYLDSDKADNFGVFMITKSDSVMKLDSSFYWPTEFGAPHQNSIPLLYNDFSIWTKYNANDTLINIKFPELEFLPKPLEVSQIVYPAMNLPNDYNKNVFFIEYEIINKSNELLDSVYIGIWTDIDLRYSNCGLGDYPAINRDLQTGYCWHKTTNCNSNSVVGFKLLYGPQVQSIGNTAIYKGGVKQDYENLKLSSFHPIFDDFYHNLFGDVAGFEEYWNVARGFGNDGTAIINPETNLQTKFPFDGNPIDSTGWTYDEYYPYTGGGAGYTMFTGPITLAPNDTQWVMIAGINTHNTSHQASIEKFNQISNYLGKMSYKDLVVKQTLWESDLDEIPSLVSLYQNYPNPFNPTTTIKYSVGQISNLTYDKQKNNLSHSKHVTLKVYNTLGQEVATLVNKQQSPGNYEVQFDGTKLNSGVYFYRLETDGFVKTQKMVLLK